MNKKVLVLAVALMAVAMLATPALAETPKKIPVTFELAGPHELSVGERWTTEGGEYHSRGGFLSVGGHMLKIGNEVFLSGHSYSTFIQNMNLKTGEGKRHHHSTLVYQEGTFEGHINVKGTFTIMPNGYMRGIDSVTKGVWHGTGAYQGWTLVQEYATGQPRAGYLLIP